MYICMYTYRERERETEIYTYTCVICVYVLADTAQEANDKRWRRIQKCLALIEARLRLLYSNTHIYIYI